MWRALEKRNVIVENKMKKKEKNKWFGVAAAGGMGHTPRVGVVGAE